MTRMYSLVVESGPNGFSGYVPELPSILVTGRSAEELTARATEAIRIYWEMLRAEPFDDPPTFLLRAIWKRQ